MNKLNEKLDFSFSIKDFSLITEILEYYLQDRLFAFNNLDFSKPNNIESYINYFLCPKTEKYHPYLFRIQHFIDRDYEFFNKEEIGSLVGKLRSLLRSDYDSIINIKDFQKYEFDCINDIFDNWDIFYQKVQDYPLLVIDSFTYDDSKQTPIYYDTNTDKFILNTVHEFLEIVSKAFPVSLRRLDSIILCDSEYIDFVAGEGTMAFFINDNIFMPKTVKEEDKNFFIETIYHEFGHYMFSGLYEADQILWYDLYEEWVKKDIQLTREEGKNEVEELFADAFSIKYSPVNDFIEKPSEIVIESFTDILNHSYTKGV
jgi:hypothetical protein